LHSLSGHAFSQIEKLITHHIDTCRVVVHFPLHKQVHDLSIKRTPALLAWTKSQTDFIELMSSLGQSEAIIKSDGTKVTTKELIDHFSEHLGYTVHSWENKISKARQRKNGGSKFLANLQSAFVCTKL
jgi:hypothetical protein